MKEEPKKHKPCKHRKRETRDGVELDWCYAIGFDRIGDMPCEYCVDWPTENAAGKKTQNSESKSKHNHNRKGKNRQC